MAEGIGATITEDRLAVPQMDKQQPLTQQCHPRPPLAIYLGEVTHMYTKPMHTRSQPRQC